MSRVEQQKPDAGSLRGVVWEHPSCRWVDTDHMAHPRQNPRWRGGLALVTSRTAWLGAFHSFRCAAYVHAVCTCGGGAIPPRWVDVAASIRGFMEGEGVDFLSLGQHRELAASDDDV